jgi:hypothetical protein
MSDDRLRGLFGQFAAMTVTVPPADRAAERGRRRRRARFRAATVAWTLVLAGGFGAPQAASIASPSGSNLRVQSSASGGGRAPIRSNRARVPSDGPALASKHSSLARPDAGSSSPGQGVAKTADRLEYGRLPGRSLPPRGAGQLLLGLDAAGRFVMTRMGSHASPVPVPGIGLPAGAPPVLVTNPAGGWVVVVSSADGWRRVRPSRLAVVAATGKSEPFGPIFFTETVTSAAVDPGGSRVAIALSRPLTRPRIEVVPLPGHRGHDRSWRLRSVRASVVTSLSWAPDGRRLSYLRGQQRPTRMSIRGPVTLQVTGRAAAGSARLGWPSVAIRSSGCVPDVTAWLGRSGRFAALEHCAGKRSEVLQPADPRTALGAGRATVVARRARCGSAALDPSPAGGAVLISYCGIYLYQHGKLTKVPGGLTAAALAG